jgi:hypothetical protein
MIPPNSSYELRDPRFRIDFAGGSATGEMPLGLKWNFRNDLDSQSDVQVAEC